jgi:ubiquinone/menaquinone biosynthesis C-methylase UbiE
MNRMSTSEEKQDRHFPLFAHEFPLRSLFHNPKKYCSYVTAGQVVADLGCGAGHYTLALAERVGPEGRVYAIDSDEKAIQRVKEKANQHGYHNLEAYATSAHDLHFIPDGSVDFILANTLLCSMAPQFHASTANEMRRILKSSGRAYLSAGKDLSSYIRDQSKWDEILAGFNVEQRDDGWWWFGLFGERWAVVSPKQR